MDNMYKIKPLRWEKEGTFFPQYTAWTPFGDYEVSKWNGQWRWGYCFDEYHDEDQEDCRTMKEGKQKAEDHWRERILPILVLKGE